jgi:hypothetical protein
VGYSAAEWQSGTAEHERAFDISLCMSWGTGYSSADWEVLISEFPMLNVCYHTAPHVPQLMVSGSTDLAPPRSQLLLCDLYARRTRLCTLNIWNINAYILTYD